MAYRHMSLHILAALVILLIVPVLAACESTQPTAAVLDTRATPTPTFGLTPIAPSATLAPVATPTTATPAAIQENDAAIKAMHWTAEGTQWTQLAIDSLEAISVIDPTAAKLILTFPWVVDDITATEASAISSVRCIADEDAGLAQAVLSLEWVQHDLSTMKQYAAASLCSLARSNRALAWQLIGEPFIAPPFRQRDEYLLKVLADLSHEPPGVTAGAELLAQLGTHDWFNDGLDDQDAVLLFAIANSPRAFQQALLQTHYMASTAVNLPLAGRVDITVVRHTPFPEEDRSLIALEEGLRVAEDFMGVPFPVGEVVLIVAEPELWQVGTGRYFGDLSGGGPEPAYLTALIVSSSSESGPESGALYHEISHHYSLSGHPWLSEGAAQFIEAFTRDRLGVESISQRVAHLDEGGCGRENIAAHIGEYGGDQCDYYLGERFFLAVHEALGQDVISAALRELYGRSQFFEFLDEDTIYYAFLSSTPAGKREIFNAVYRRYHAGPASDSLPEDSPDRPSLVALYNATGGEQWIENKNWVSAAPLGAWHGVSAEVGGRVRLLELIGNRLSGRMPPELGNLSDLRELWLDGNQLMGAIPPELGNLSELVVLGLGSNRLSGHIPAELGNLPEVGAIFLFENQLEGGIPPDLGKASSLRMLKLGFNRLSGAIPPQIGNIVHLESLGLGHNQLSGEIPRELGNLLNLTWLDVGTNQLGGEIPVELGNLTQLILLRLSENDLTGSIPAELGSLTNLESLELHGNQLTGEIPAALGDAVKLQALRLDENQLSGAIPPALGNLTDLRSLDLRNNQLGGDIPAALASLHNLEELYLSGNRFTGCIPDGLRDVPKNDLAQVGLPFCGAASS